MAGKGKDAVRQAGFCKKLGFDSGKWQNRYFTLTNDSLTYYTDKGGREKGKIPVGEIISAEKVAAGCAVGKEACSKAALQHPVPEHSFRVVTQTPGGKERVYYMSCERSNDVDAWLTAFVIVQHYHKSILHK